MNYSTKQADTERHAIARESFSGVLQTNAEYYQLTAIVDILKRQIHLDGTFKEMLGDYTYAYARTKQIDAMRTETIVRDLFKHLNGLTMNQMRETLLKNEENLPAKAETMALDHADAVGQMIEGGIKITFNRAFAHQAEAMARALDITDAGAKRLMKEAFKAVHNHELYDWGKEMEEKFYRPQIEAEKQQREEQSQVRENARGRRQLRMQYQR